jgi:HAD superfamily hydrolase (TIGR01549 family)
VVATREAAALPAASLDGYVWQPQLTSFAEYSVDFAVDVRGQSSPLAFRRRVRLLGGFAIMSEPGAPAGVRQLAQNVVEHLSDLGVLGPMNLQILSTGDGFWVSDLNPRIGTSMPLSLAAGHNPVAFLLEGWADRVASVQAAPSGQGGRALRFLEERYVPDLGLEDIGGVVFDLDDTLLDQKTWILDKLEITWSQARDILPSRKAFLTRALRIVEEGNRAHLFDALCQELGLEEAIRQHLIHLYRVAEPEQGLLYADALPCLDRLRRMGYRLGLLTDNPTASQRLKIQVCGLEPCFDALLYTSELGAPKPDHRSFATAAEALGLPASRLVMVGDNLFRDLHGALEADYGHAFHIQRPGAFFNFNPALARRASGSGDGVTALSGLHELLWHLSGARV